MKDQVKTLLTIVAIIAALGLAGESDMQAAVAEQAQYCAMVADGTWPDYRGDFAEVCQ